VRRHRRPDRRRDAHRVDHHRHQVADRHQPTPRRVATGTMEADMRGLPVHRAWIGVRSPPPWGSFEHPIRADS
jgi:hypothetical protein